MHSMEISRGPKTGCSPFSKCLKVGFPVQYIHQGSEPFLFFPSPLFRILITLAICPHGPKVMTMMIALIIIIIIIIMVKILGLNYLVPTIVLSPSHISTH